jgi:sugar/nucleoside kinase (ribokinase family)
VVIKRGARGCEAIEGERRWRVAAPPARAVDSTGAGDAFVAGFLAARLRGAPIETCLQQAVAAGAKATEIVGARPEPRN